MGAAPWGSAEKMTFPFLCLAEGAGSLRPSSRAVLVLAGPGTLRVWVGLKK